MMRLANRKIRKVKWLSEFQRRDLGWAYKAVGTLGSITLITNNIIAVDSLNLRVR